MLIYALIALGGAIGAMARYWLAGLVHRFMPAYFPYGTLTVNVVGCLAFGIILGFSEERLVAGSAVRAFLLIGILGGFTTFSSFAFETFALLRDGESLLAMANVVGQVLLGLLAVWSGYRVMSLL